jgi:hypothetical protein
MQPDYDKIKTWIDSCSNPFQLECCKRCCELFLLKHGEEKFCADLVLQLESAIDLRERFINYSIV